MKKLVALTLCGALTVAPLNLNAVPKETPGDHRNSAILAICAMGGTAMIAGFVYFKVRACKPKYYCVKDGDGNQFPSNASRTERAANDWSVVGGPYNTAEAAAAACPRITNSPTAGRGLIAMTANLQDDPAIYIPAIPIKIWKSTNLVDWVLRDTILDDPSHFTWTDTNAINANSKAFYRASY